MGSRSLTLIFALIIFLGSSQARALTQDVHIVIYDDPDNLKSHLTAKFDMDGKVNYILLNGPEVSEEPNGIGGYEAAHDLIYGVIEDENDKLENVIFENVFPYHYNFDIDSNNVIHVAFIADYELYYAKGKLGSWEIERLSSNHNWYAYAPDITLGKDEQPRIVSAVNYQEGANQYWDLPEGYTLNQSTTIHYDYLKGEEWYTFDVTDNHFAQREHPGLSHDFRSRASQRTFNPAILIDNGRAWIAYNNKNALSVESRIQLLDTVEFPDELDLADYAFFDNTTLKTAVSSTISTTYTRPSIRLLSKDPTEPEKQPMILGFGSWVFGGANLAFSSDANSHLSTLWKNFEVDRSLRSRQVLSFDTKIDLVSETLWSVWSVYDRFDTAENRYTYDIRMMELSFSAFDDLKLDDQEVEFKRISDSVRIDHKYPNLIDGGDSLEIMFLRNANNGEIVGPEYFTNPVIVEPSPQSTTRFSTVSGLSTNYGLHVTMGFILAVGVRFKLVHKVELNFWFES
ncbi:MAG: hypothetical protein IH840_18215 [Candidatus Heimdallarchaeota archaeon]|nr:hypothetical protein [Candidatus Heimdallarchaeota archaeon]